MRLKQIKLAGFKSFVDPTTVTLPGNLCAIVGPNGGGKSNIVDAVRWVMGESSAKQLRGEKNLTDVIFHGCGTRPMAGVASIELTFENADGRIGGEYAAYGEIAIRRQVSRDSQSNYYLNGTRCRRRDVADIFLGTGFGRRGYSIIEQGMISQIAKARPEELRDYLEEAAGISKYKERRRETENRIRHTRENLDRLGDTRDELGRTLQRLQRQARAAERYKELKREERHRAAELHGIHYLDLTGRLQSLDEGLRKKEADLERLRAGAQSVETRITALRVRHEESNEESRQQQAAFYQLREAIARIEQTLKLDRARLAGLEGELDGLSGKAAETERQLGMDQQAIDELRAALAELSPRVEQAQKADSRAAAQLEQLQQADAACQEEWDAFSAKSAETMRTTQIQASRIEHGEALLADLAKRLKRLADEEAAPADVELTQIDRLATEIDAQQMQRATIEEAAEQCYREIAGVRESILNHEAELDEARRELQALRHELATLGAAQEVALGRADDGVGDWLAEQGLANAERVGEALSVVTGWEWAVEMVLGDFLQGLRVEDALTFAEALPQLEGGRVALVEGRFEAVAEGDLPSLGSLIRSSNLRLGSLLHGVFAAESDAAALAGRAKLRPGESIVTRSGLWLGPDWLRMLPDRDEAAGVLQRGQKLETLEVWVEEVETSVARRQGELERERAALRELEHRRDALQRQADTTNGTLAELNAEQGVQRVKLETADTQRRRLRQERMELERQINAEREPLAAAREHLANAERAALEQAPLGEALAKKKKRLRGALERASQAARSRHDEFHALHVERQGGLARMEAIQLARRRLVEQAEEFESRRAALTENIEQATKPLPGLQTELEAKLAEQLEVEERQRAMRAHLDGIGEQIRALETERDAAAAQVDAVRGEVEATRVERQGLLVEQANVRERLEATGHKLRDVLDTLPDDATVPAWEQRLERLDRSIRRLEPVNLAAIEEYGVESERKAWLDAQHDDLHRALETLRTAIRKIDAETRSRFKTTFAAVNGHFSEIFPRLFGGGRGELALTGEDLLDTGVSVLARPPGKRNASVRQLSGGEQALTAVALLFSIFRLNPSPVCVLDEIDAPLDDSNVGRVAELIREMSGSVQFIVITHNKLTMETADFLIGVTMAEAGVSRLVSVAIGEAAAMAATA